MDCLYCTADKVGLPDHGGGQVTGNEARALSSLGICKVYGRDELDSQGNDPWGWDECLNRLMDDNVYLAPGRTRLAHFYAGTFSKSVSWLQSWGVKVTYTAAAHSVEESRREHERLGFAYDYPHLNDPKLWERYVRGYLEADRLVVPSTHSRDVMLSFGASPDRVVLIPHGVWLPTRTVPLPNSFTVGYLGNCSAPDKGLIYLLQAWQKLNLPDARLLLGGRDSTSPYVRFLCETFCPTARVERLGWIENVSDFYNQLSLYVQPSVTEGFGIEVLEAMAHGRPVICSDGAGASDVLRDMKPYSTRVVKARDVDDLEDAIQTHLDLGYPMTKKDYEYGPVHAENYTWDKIRQRYVQMWKELLYDSVPQRCAEAPPEGQQGGSGPGHQNGGEGSE